MREELTALNYREFLAAALKTAAKGQRPMSYAEFSRRAGFASRSYPADVLKGNRRITPATLPQFAKGLRLKGLWKEYFALLVAQEEADVNIDRLSSSVIQQKLERLRERISTADATRAASATPAKFYERRGWLEVYAALGKVDRGATLSEIETRTGFSNEKCQKILSAMAMAGVVQPQSERFLPCSRHVIFAQLGGETFFQQHFLDLLRDMESAARSEGFQSKENLFFTSVFSVRKKRVLELRERLRDLLLEFADTSEEAEGDGIAKICLGFQVPGSLSSRD